ncbi:MAG: sensor histidine kinase [Bacteroidetes bacterium]|nr:sensor histidine kinase [Bacteroidota bacterium]
MKLAFKSKYGFIVLHMLIWTAVLTLPYLVSSGKKGYGAEGIPALIFTYISLVNIAIFYLHAYVIFPAFFNRRRWWLYIPAVILLIGGSLMLKWNILFVAFWTVAKRFPWFSRYVFVSSYAFFILSFFYRLLVDRFRAEREQKERQTTELLTELKFLRSQISPHFLFNVLTNLVSLARKKSDNLEPALIKLSELLRYMLYDTQGKKVSLQTEVDYLNNYLDLQRLRFGNDVDIDSRIDLDEETSVHVIEPMLLIPFVENAFKHGVGYSGRPGIVLRLSVAFNTLSFEVRNKFEPEPAETKDESSGIGLGNVLSRLNLLYRDKYTLTINDTNGVFHIVLTLQLL